jgi:hypothetical protein
MGACRSLWLPRNPPTPAQGTDANHISGWDDAANAAIGAGATHLLGFNEPDLNTQANMSPQAAADAWRQHMQPYAGRAKLVSPAITNGAPPMGTGWMDAFLVACTGCQIDAIAIHIYDSASNVPYFQTCVPGALGAWARMLSVV